MSLALLVGVIGLGLLGAAVVVKAFSTAPDPTPPHSDRFTRLTGDGKAILNERDREGLAFADAVDRASPFQYLQNSVTGEVRVLRFSPFLAWDTFDRWWRPTPTDMATIVRQSYMEIPDGPLGRTRGDFPTLGEAQAAVEAYLKEEARVAAIEAGWKKAEVIAATPRPVEVSVAPTDEPVRDVRHRNWVTIGG